MFKTAPGRRLGHGFIAADQIMDLAVAGISECARNATARTRFLTRGQFWSSHSLHLSAGAAEIRSLAWSCFLRGAFLRPAPPVGSSRSRAAAAVIFLEKASGGVVVRYFNFLLGDDVAVVGPGAVMQMTPVSFSPLIKTQFTGSGRGIAAEASRANSGSRRRMAGSSA